jgi:hypothetical protein
MVVTGLLTGVEIPGREVQNARRGGVSHRWVTPQYFRTLGIPLLRGRDVQEDDTGDRAWVAVVSESFVIRHWPGQVPIGRTFVHRGRPRTIIGVVRDIRVRGLERSSEPQMYLPAAQIEVGVLPFYDPKELVIRHSGQEAALPAGVRQIVRAADPDHERLVAPFRVVPLLDRREERVQIDVQDRANAIGRGHAPIVASARVSSSGESARNIGTSLRGASQAPRMTHIRRS